jgi:hypothetical protein
MIRTYPRAFVGLVIPVAVGFVVAIGARYWSSQVRNGGYGPASGMAASADSTTRGGPELVLVIITSVSCAACHDARLPDLVERVDRALRAKAGTRQWHYASVGIIVSDDARVGMEYVKRFVTLDEVIAGHGGLNSGLLKYVSSEFRGPMATPQNAIVLRRTTGFDIEKGSEQIVLRRIGGAAISQWLEAGALLPALQS